MRNREDTDWLKSHVSLERLIGADAPLTRSGSGEPVGLCPFHSGQATRRRALYPHALVAASLASREHAARGRAS